MGPKGVMIMRSPPAASRAASPTTLATNPKHRSSFAVCSPLVLVGHASHPVAVRHVEPRRQTVSEYFTRWPPSIKPRVRLRTFADYDSLVERYLQPVVGREVGERLRDAEVLRRAQPVPSRLDSS